MGLLLYCEQLQPTDAATQQSLGYMYQGLQQPEKALAHYRRAYESDPTMYWSNYATLLFQSGETETTIRTLEETARLLPKETDVLEALQTVYTSAGDIKKALRTADKIEATEGINAYNTMARYRLHLAAGQPAKAIQAIERYLKENPEDARFRVFRGDFYMAAGKEEEALNIYYEEQKAHPENPYVWLSLADYSERKGDGQRASEYIEKAVLADGWGLQEKLHHLLQNEERIERRAGSTERILLRLKEEYPLEEDTYQALVRLYLNRGDNTNAKAILHDMTSLNPDNEGTWKTLMQVLQSDTTSTDEEFTEVIENAYKHFPDEPQWNYWMARVLLPRNGEEGLDSTLTFLKQAVKKGGRTRYHIGMWTLIGDIYSMQGADKDSLYAAYDEALKIDPTNAYVLNNYAYTLATSGGDLRKAEKMSQKTIEEAPDNPTYLDTYAWILHLQGQDMLAEFYIRKALENLQNEEGEEVIREHYNTIIKR